jgi:hypothetical protein
MLLASEAIQRKVCLKTFTGLLNSADRTPRLDNANWVRHLNPVTPMEVANHCNVAAVPNIQDRNTTSTIHISKVTEL